jgi:pimeloyl-ACP methyl ester carboxylesterase
MALQRPYLPIRASTQAFVAVRGYNYLVRQWLPVKAIPEAKPLVMLHGFMDVGASFQFVVDALNANRHVIAFDWRGFGLSTPQVQNTHIDSYWFADYLGDLDALLDIVQPNTSVDLLGHSMGGNIATVYAGVRPMRISKLINLEGFGLPDTTPDQAPARYAKWLDQLKEPQRLRSYASLSEVAQRMQKSNPRLTTDKALWLAAFWAAEGADKQWNLLSDVAHKRSNPILYRDEEIAACRRRISAPTLWVTGAQSDLLKLWSGQSARAVWDARLTEVPQLQSLTIDDCGHMIHHDQAEQLAHAIEQFLS